MHYFKVHCFVLFLGPIFRLWRFTKSKTQSRNSIQVSPNLNINKLINGIKNTFLLWEDLGLNISCTLDYFAFA